MRVTDPNSLWGRVTNYFGLNTAPKLILLDVGMTAELSPQDSENLMAFFKVRARLVLSLQRGVQLLSQRLLRRRSQHRMARALQKTSLGSLRIKGVR